MGPPRKYVFGREERRKNAERDTGGFLCTNYDYKIEESRAHERVKTVLRCAFAVITPQHTARRDSCI